jgi:C1A family cysteine protease
MDTYDSRDFKFGAAEKEELPQAVSLRENFKFCFDQGQLGSCGLNSGVMNLMYLYGFDIPLLSRLYGYYKVRELEGNVNEDSGVTLRNVCKVLQQTGVCVEDLFPYVIQKFKNKPTVEMDIDAQKHKIKGYYRVRTVDEVKKALNNGYPILVGMLVFEEMESKKVAKTGIVPMPADPNNVLGGHAVLLTGYEDAKEAKGLMKLFRSIFRKPNASGYVELQNSWGEDWGDNGFFKFSYEYFDNYVIDAWVLTL